MNPLPSRRSLAAFAVFALLLTFSGCLCGQGVNRGDINLISLDQEWAMGDRIEREMDQQLAYVDDPVVQQYIDELGRRLVEQTDLRGREWTFHVVADEALNAFATPGGNVYMNAGLLEAADGEEEVAGVMAHEVAHVVARHGTERLTKIHGMEVVASLLLGESPGIVEQIAVGILGSGAVAKFSRDDEREADALGVELMAEAGFAPSGMAGMFEKLLEVQQRRPNAVERFFASHPLTEERIREVRGLAADVDASAAPASAGPDFEAVQRRLAGTGSPARRPSR